MYKLEKPSASENYLSLTWPRVVALMVEAEPKGEIDQLRIVKFLNTQHKMSTRYTVYLYMTRRRVWKLALYQGEINSYRGKQLFDKHKSNKVKTAIVV